MSPSPTINQRLHNMLCCETHRTCSYYTRQMDHSSSRREDGIVRECGGGDKRDRKEWSQNAAKVTVRRHVKAAGNLKGRSDSIYDQGCFYK